MWQSYGGIATDSFERAGLAGAWIGLTVQHCGNHGAMSTSPIVNRALGLCDDLIGGSSLLWQYHHQARCKHILSNIKTLPRGLLRPQHQHCWLNTLVGSVPGTVKQDAPHPVCREEVNAKATAMAC